MTKLFKNEKDLEQFLLQKCKTTVAQTENKVYAIIKRFLVGFYQEYDPVMYERTNQFLHSLVKSGIRKTRNGYEAEVYFDLGYIYNSGANPSGEQVMQAAEWGRHGAMDLMVADFKGKSVWHESLAELDAKAIGILVDMLKAEGIPIK